MWLKRYKNVRFRDAPRHGLSQIAIWFSIPATQSLDGASFTSVEHLVAHIDALIARYNQSAKPFLWTKSKVCQSASTVRP